MERHVPGLRKLLYSIFKGNIHDMEDAEQEILLGIFLKLEKFGFRSSFKTFLFSFARNKSIDLLRKKKREQNKVRAVRSIDRAQTGLDPEEIAASNMLKEQLDRAILDLGEEERSLIMMRETAGFSIEECARVFKIPEGTVKSRLHAIRLKLFQKLKEESI
jgi:RNA polymerase sigma-70 factor, ECF subfamily